MESKEGTGKGLNGETDGELVPSIAIIYLLIPGFLIVQVYKINNITNQITAIMDVKIDI